MSQPRRRRPPVDSLTVYRSSKRAIDQHEVFWWRVDEFGLHAHKARYHVNTSWRAGTKGMGYSDKPGAPFENEWQLFQLQSTGKWHFTGRSADGWDALKGEWNTDVYTSREAALQALKTYCQNRIKYLRSEISRFEQLGTTT